MRKLKTLIELIILAIIFAIATPFKLISETFGFLSYIFGWITEKISSNYKYFK